MPGIESVRNISSLRPEIGIADSNPSVQGTLLFAALRPERNFIFRAYILRPPRSRDTGRWKIHYLERWTKWVMGVFFASRRF